MKNSHHEGSLSDRAHKGIIISLAVVAQASRIYSQRDREACLWLANVAANSQRIQLVWQRRKLPDPLGCVGRITEADLAHKLGLEPYDIYTALTGRENADLPRFTAAVERFRKEFEAALPPIVQTEDTKTIRKAVKTAMEDHELVTIEAKWRAGKTEECQRMWLQNLHRAIWIDTPVGGTEKDFFYAIASALGIGLGANSGKKTPLIKKQIDQAIGIGLVDTMFFDEAHNTLPTDVQTKRPVRLEHIRQYRDARGVGSILVVTEQFSLALEMSLQGNTRWAPGQFIGRRYSFRLRDSHNDAEIKAIARVHAGAALNPELLPELLTYAKGSEGYLGSMTAVIRGAIREAESNDRTVFTAQDLAMAMKDQAAEERIVALAKAVTPATRRQLSLRVQRRAA